MDSRLRGNDKVLGLSLVAALMPDILRASAFANVEISGLALVLEPVWRKASAFGQFKPQRARNWVRFRQAQFKPHPGPIFLPRLFADQRLAGLIIMEIVPA